MLTNGCREGEELFIEVICDGHSIRPPESIYELLGFQNATINHFLQYFLRNSNKNLGGIL